jgi:DNA (cytosine-5)-methyltransferase 1
MRHPGISSSLAGEQAGRGFLPVDPPGRKPIGMTVCSGIGAAEVSAPWIDWRYQSEIEKFPSAVLAHRFPNAVNLGDMTNFKEWPDADVDVFCGGTPCQSFSVAGLRKGLDDPRGNLMLTYLAIAARYRPGWVVWENVPGVLSSNGGRDFGSFLGGLGELGYGFAYRVLDAQFTRTRDFPRAVPQRRRRVFVVGYLGDWRRAAAVLFDGESLQGNPAPRRKAGQSTSVGAASGVAIRGREGGGTAELTGNVATALRASQGGGDKPHVMAPPAANPLTARMHKGINTTMDEGQTMVAHSLRGEGFDESEDGTGRGTPMVVAFAENSRAEVRLCGGDGSVMSQLTTGGGKPGQGQPTIASPWAVRRVTPTDCERLQGFPDGFTAIEWRGKPADLCPDGPRYKALGNSWAINCGQYVFDRMQMVEAMT